MQTTARIKKASLVLLLAALAEAVALVVVAAAAADTVTAGVFLGLVVAGWNVLMAPVGYLIVREDRGRERLAGLALQLAALLPIPLGLAAVATAPPDPLNGLVFVFFPIWLYVACGALGLVWALVTTIRRAQQRLH